MNDNNDIKFIIGKNKGVRILHDGYLFKRHNGHFPTTTWNCIDSCGFYVITKDWIQSEVHSVHKHEPHKEKITEIYALMEMRKRVLENCTRKVGRIVKDVRNEVTKKNKDVMPLDYLNTTRNMQRYRNANFPSAPISLQDIAIEGQWKMDAHGSATFLQINDGSSDRILAFFTLHGLELLSKSKHILGDGTFKVMPTLFSQLYVLHGEAFGKFFPCVFFLLPGKSEEIYIRALQLFQTKALEYGASFQPKVFHIDYERAMINAIEKVFVETKVQGCMFHYTQCIWKQVQELGLVTAYKTNDAVYRWIRRLSALPLVPESEVWPCYFATSEEFPDEIHFNKVEAFHNYMVETWIDERDGLFKRHWWNQYRNDGPRTTNNAEGWHNNLNNIAENRHLSLFQFISVLHTIQLDTESEYEDFLTKPDREKQAKYARIDKKIANAKLRLSRNQISPMKYLDVVAKHLKLE